MHHMRSWHVSNDLQTSRVHTMSRGYVLSHDRCNA